MKAKLIKEAYGSARGVGDWYEAEVEATFQAYGLDDIEIDLILNDPDVAQEIKDAEERGFGPEKTALYLLQKADESGLVPNEKSIEEYGEDHPAQEWREQEADRRWQRDNQQELDWDEMEEPYDEMDESLNEGFATEEGRNLDRIASWLGYDDLHEMLGDNPGLFEACLEWIDQTFGEQLIEDLFQEGMDPEAIERVGLWNVAEEVKQRYEDEPQM